MGSIPGWGTKSPQAAKHSQEKKRKMGYLALRGSSQVELTLSGEHLCFMCLKSGKARWPGRPHDFPCSWPTLLIHLIYRLWVYDFELPWWLRCKESACNAGDLGLIPGLERSPGEGNGTPLQYSYLENSVDSGALRATVHGVEKSQTRLNN